MSDPGTEPLPPPEPRRSVEGIVILSGLGISFVTAGAALADLGGLFRALGVLLVVTGMGIIGAAVWPQARLVLLTRLEPSVRRLSPRHLGSRGRAFAALGVVTLLLTGAGAITQWQQEESDPQVTGLSLQPNDVGPVDIREECDMIAGRCVLEAPAVGPGEPLVSTLGDSPEDQSPNAILTADVRLIGATERRYVAIACRSTDAGEYVLAVWPDGVSFELFVWDAGERIILESGRWPGTIRDGDGANRLELRCVGPDIGASINGTPIPTSGVEQHGVQHSTGVWYVASGISRFEVVPPGPVAATFDNIRLETVPAVSLATPQA